MNQEELVANLGTIARSGSKVTVFFHSIDTQETIQLIHQFILMNVTLVFIVLS